MATDKSKVTIYLDSDTAELVEAIPKFQRSAVLNKVLREALTVPAPQSVMTEERVRHIVRQELTWSASVQLVREEDYLELTHHEDMDRGVDEGWTEFEIS